MSDSALRRQVAQLAAELARTQAEVHTLRRGARRPQLGHSSIDSGSLDVVDSETGQVRLRLGYQPDGSVGVVPEGGDPHPAPNVPVVEPIPSGLSVSWDGTLDGLEQLPADFDHVNVYVSPESGFTPSGSTFVGTITRSGGSLPVAPLEVGETYYVRLVPVGTGGVQGTPSSQASGVPAPVGGVPGPGSITETEIADDAISTPKLQAEAVTALKIAAQAIEAGHIQAAAVTASKLEADLVLGTRIIAGNPSGARVELDEDGLRGYNADDALVFAIDDGNAVFTGNITGSVISGSQFLLDGTGGTSGVIEQDPGQELVRSQVTSASRARAQIQASPGQAEFSVWGDHADPDTPAGGVLAQPGAAQLGLYSNLSLGTSAPFMSFSANPTQATSRWRSDSGAEVRILAAGSASAQFTPPAPTDPTDQQGEGHLFANRNQASDIAAVSLQSPRWEASGSPAFSRRSVIFAEGANTGRPYTRVVQAARRILVMGEAVGGDFDTTTDGMLDIADTHSIRAPRHHTIRTDMVSLPTAVSTGDFVDFTTAQMPARTFTTSWSGRTRVIIQMCGINYRTNGSTIALGFRLSGAGTIPAGLSRAAMVRSVGAGGPATLGRTAFQLVDLDLAGNATYTLTPMWRISGSGYAWSGNDVMQSFDFNYQNSIIVEPLM